MLTLKLRVYWIFLRFNNTLLKKLVVLIVLWHVCSSHACWDPRCWYLDGVTVFLICRYLFFLPIIFSKNLEHLWSCVYVSASAGILTCLANLPLLICLMFMLTCSTVSGVTSIGRSACPVLTFSGIIGAGLLKSAPKCSTHLFFCFWTLVIDLPSFSKICRSILLYFSAFLFAVSYCRHMYPFLAVISAVTDRSPTYFFLISFSASLYSPVCFCLFSLCLGFLCFSSVDVNRCILIL